MIIDIFVELGNYGNFISRFIGVLTLLYNNCLTVNDKIFKESIEKIKILNVLFKFAQNCDSITDINVINKKGNENLKNDIESKIKLLTGKSPDKIDTSITKKRLI